jgi:hypothetical protein
MYVNPFWFGFFTGFISAIVVLVLIAFTAGGKKK